MQDRISENPGRVLISPENGAAYYATMTRADNATQEGTPLNKNSLLKDATAGLFDLGSDAVPDDVFRVLSRFQHTLGNEYVWAKLGKSVSLGAAKSDKAILVYKTLYYSDSVDVNGQLVNPQTGVMTSSSVIATLKGLAGKYFYFTGSASTAMATIFPDNTVFYMESCNPVAMAGTDNSIYTGAVYRSVSIAVDTTYVNSPYADTYPPAESDGYTYTSLGRLGNKVQIATGSYVGTGTAGSSNKNGLTFAFVPKVVIVVANQSNLGGAGTVFVHGQTKSAGIGRNYNNASLELTVSWSGNTVQWYNASNADFQLNLTNITYYYAAIG